MKYHLEEEYEYDFDLLEYQAMKKITGFVGQSTIY